MDDRDGFGTSAKQRREEEKARRLALALRANLARRKASARERRGEDEPGSDRAEGEQG